MFSELVNPIFTQDGEQVKVSVSVKYLDQRTKATQISQFDLTLEKDSNWLTEILGIDEFDDEVFLEKVDFINVPKQYTLEVHLKDGTVVTKPCRNTGHKDCWTKEYRNRASKQRRKNGTKPKGASVFTGKLKCKHCGCNYRRCTQPSATSEDGKYYYWRCAERTKCKAQGLREDFLKSQFEYALGMTEWDDTIFAEKVDHINIDGYQLEIIFKDESATSMTFMPPKKKGKPCSEEQKAHMRKLMKERWTPERKAEMSLKMKKIRSEKYWTSKGK